MADQNPNANASTSTSMDFPVFIETNLGSTLVMVASHDDTVRDLKKKVATEHGFTFPDIGEITVHAIKVHWVGSSYCLSDLMLVRKAFDGNNETRFLYVDASIVDTTKGHNTDNTGNFLIKHNVQKENFGLLQSEPRSSYTLVNIPDPRRYSAGHSTFTDSTVAEKGDMIIDASGDKVTQATKGYSDVIGNSLSEPEKRTDVDQVEKAVAGPSVRIKTDLLVVQEQDDLRDSKHEYIHDEITGQCMYSMKRKNGKQRNELQDDDQAELLSIGRKRHKKKKENTPLIKFIIDPKTSEDDDIYKSELQDDNRAQFASSENKRRKKSNKVVSVTECIVNAKATDANSNVYKTESVEVLHEKKLENKCEENALGSASNQFVSQNGLELLPSNITKSKKRRKKSTKPHCEPVDIASSRINELCPPLDKGKGNGEAGLCDLSQNKSGGALAVGKQGSNGNAGITLENKIEEPESSHHLKESIKSGPAMSCISLPDTENVLGTLVEEIVEKICQQPSKHTSEVPTEKLAAALLTEDADQNEINGNIIKVDSRVPSAKKTQLSNPKATACETPTSLLQQVTGKSTEEEHSHSTDLAEQSSGQITVQEVVDPGIPLEDISKVYSNNNRSTRCGRKKSVKASDSKPRNGTTESGSFVSLPQQVTEKDSEETTNHHVDMDKQTNVDVHLQEVVDYRIQSEVIAKVLPADNDKISRHGRKKIGKMDSSLHVLSSNDINKGDLAVNISEKNPEKAPDSQAEFGKQPNTVVSYQEVAVSVILSDDNTKNDSANPGRASQCSRKKSVKTDSSHHKLSNDDNIHVELDTTDAFKVAEDAQTLGNLSKSKLPIPSCDGDKCALDNANLLKCVNELPGKGINEMPLPRVTPLNGSVENLEAADVVKITRSDAEEINFAEAFLPQAVKCGLVASEKGPTTEAETNKTQSEKPKCKRSKENSKPKGKHVMVACKEGITTREEETKETEEKPQYERETGKSDIHLHDSSPHAENSCGLLDQKIDTKKSRILGESSCHNTGGTNNEPGIKEVQTGKSRIKKGDKKQEIGDVFYDSGSAKVPQNNKHIKLPPDIKRKFRSNKIDAIVDSKVEESRSKIHGGSYASVDGTFADNPTKEFDASIIASRDSTAYNTKRYRVAVRKVPGRELEMISNNSEFCARNDT